MQTTKEIDEMFSNGIVLSTGMKLNNSEMAELSRLFTISDGIASYNYVRENVDDDVIDKYPPIEELPVELFEDITYAERDCITGEDEIWAVRSAMKRRREKANG